jgi:hypothetical protein
MIIRPSNTWFDLNNPDRSQLVSDKRRNFENVQIGFGMLTKEFLGFPSAEKGTSCRRAGLLLTK